MKSRDHSPITIDTRSYRRADRRAVDRVNDALQPSDRVRIVTFGSHVAERVPLQAPPVAFTLSDVGDGTAVLDALLLSLARRRWKAAVSSACS